MSCAEIAALYGCSKVAVHCSIEAVRRKCKKYFSNHLLSETELAELQAELPTQWEMYLERLSAYMASTGKEYAGHAATIRRWAAEDQQKATAQSCKRDYSVKEGDTI